MQSVPNSINVVNSNPAHTTLCEKLGSDLRQVDDFLRVLLFPPLIKMTARNIVESGVKHHNPYPYGL